jgi:hypothetical protein
LNREKQFSPTYRIPLNPNDDSPAWMRAMVTFRCDPKEWDWWRMTQFVVRFKEKDQVVKERMIRLQRHVDGGEIKALFFDTRIPQRPFDLVEVLFWNAGSDKSIRLDNLTIEVFGE